MIRIRLFIIRFSLIIWFLSSPVSASHSNLNCGIPPNLEPLLNLLHAFTELAFIGGVGLAVLGYSISGILLMFPGEDNSRRGKKVAKNVTFGVILLLSANMIVGFITNEMGGVICG